MNDETRFRQLLIDAICGVGFPTILLGTECVQVGLAHHVGDQWGVEFAWDRLALGGVETSSLQELYDALCEQRDMNFVPDGEGCSPSLILPAH